MAVADPRFQTEVPTQETGTLPGVPEQERVPLTVSEPGPGRYLAIEGGDEPTLVPLTGNVTHIGRSPAADIVLDDASVSRRHALITRRGEQSVILDDRSLNGVIVNGARVSEAVLQDGDLIVLGRVLMRFIERS